MTFDVIVDNVMDALNLTSTDARTRVGVSVNEAYREVTSSIGLETSRRTQVSKAATIGNRYLIFTGIEKILAVIDKSSGSDVVLSQITVDEMHPTPIREEPPKRYAINRLHYNSVEIWLDCTPATTFTLYADGYVNLSTLSGSDNPDFPESFHDILEWGAMSDEYRKMEKMALMQDADRNFEKRLSDLRMFIAKSSYLDIVQGRYSGNTFRWTRDGSLVWNQ